MVPAPSMRAFIRKHMPSGPTPRTTTVSSKRKASLGKADICFARSSPTVTAMTSVSTATSEGRSSGTRTRKLPGTMYIYIVPGSFLVRVPDDLPSEVAVLTEVIAVTVGLDRAKQMSAFPSEAFLFDDTVVVLGVGPLGMCFLMKARMLGAGNIIAVDLSDYRLQFARRLGADHVINASNTTLAERLDFVRGLTHGRGADVVIETAGVPKAVPEGLEMLRLGGLLLEAGNFSDLGEVPISPFRHLCSKSVRILGVGREEPASYGPSMRQMARYVRSYPLREFVSHRFPLRDVEAAVQKSIAPDSMKVAIAPWS